ncbi:hypothetical protein GCM10020220_072140 [Nonomuraea rubra]
MAAFVLCALFVPESRAPHPRRVDPVGQVLVIVLLATLTYAFIEAPAAGWGSPDAHWLHSRRHGAGTHSPVTWCRT